MILLLPVLLFFLLWQPGWVKWPTASHRWKIVLRHNISIGYFVFYICGDISYCMLMLQRKLCIRSVSWTSALSCFTVPCINWRAGYVTARKNAQRTFFSRRKFYRVNVQNNIMPSIILWKVFTCAHIFFYLYGLAGACSSLSWEKTGMQQN